MSDMEINPTNFVQVIKGMNAAERKKLTLKKLIEVILEVPEPDDRVKLVDFQISQLQEAMRAVQERTNENDREIATLKQQKVTLEAENVARANEVNLLKREIQTRAENHPAAPPVAVPATDFASKIEHLQDQINEIEQYLRANNIELVGLPPPNAGETHETLIINACNALEGLDVVVRPEDIDISHPLNSRRTDGKPVHVVRFVQRKTKFAILAAKKEAANRLFKFRGSDVYINEHLSKPNRSLFAAAAEKKRTLNFKFLWTKNGVVNMRKDEQSEVITIAKERDFDKLQQ